MDRILRMVTEGDATIITVDNIPHNQAVYSRTCHQSHASASCIGESNGGTLDLTRINEFMKGDKLHNLKQLLNFKTYDFIS